MTTPSLRSRLADLQIPIGRIESLARTASTMLVEMGGIADPKQRTDIGDAINFADLIAEITSRLSKDVEKIEIDAPRAGEAIQKNN